MFRLCCFIALAAVALDGQIINQPIDQVNPPPAVRPYPPLSKSFGQTITELHSTLVAMKNPGATGELLRLQLADSMMALALSERQPTRPQVTAFAVELGSALSGKGFNNEQGTSLQQCLVEFMRALNVTNYEVARRLREALASLGVGEPSIDSILRRFLAIGEAVRGPDDQGLAPKVPAK